MNDFGIVLSKNEEGQKEAETIEEALEVMVLLMRVLVITRLRLTANNMTTGILSESSKIAEHIVV
jgi:hypothetical protein